MFTSFVMEDSKSYDHRLQLFFAPPMETAIQSIDYVEIRPIGQVIKDSVIEFSIPGTSNSYVDLKNSKLAIKLKLIQEDGTAIGQSNKVGLCCNTLHTVIRQVDCSLQQQNTTSAISSNYAYKAYLDVLTDPQSKVREHCLTGQLFYTDTAGAMDDVDPATGANLGLYYRSRYTRDGNVVDLEGNLYADICQQDRLIINGVPISFKFYPHRDEFSLVTTDDQKYKFEITEAVLKVCFVKIHPTFILSHSKILAHHPVVYPIQRSEIKCFGVSQGQFTFSTDNFFNSVPDVLYVGLVSSDAFVGSYKRSPFNFQHYNCNFAAFYVDGKSVPSKPFQPNFDENTYLDAYLAFSQCDEGSSLISRGDFPKGYCIYTFRTKYESQALQPVSERGQLRLDLKFSQPLPESVTVICYGKFSGVLSIDDSRNVTIE